MVMVPMQDETGVCFQEKRACLIGVFAVVASHSLCRRSDCIRPRNSPLFLFICHGIQREEDAKLEVVTRSR